MGTVDDALVEQRYRVASESHASFTVPLDVFARAMRAAATDGQDLHTNDLYLTLGCLAGDDSAIGILEREFMRPLRPSVERACKGTTSVDDVMQWTWEKLLSMAADGSPPKLAQYSGRGPLAGWLRVIALREALQDERKSKRIRIRDEAAMLEGGPAEVSVELTLLRQRFGASFRAAVHDAIARLSPEQRTILRFHTHDGLGIDQLAPILGVHRATAARRLAKARSDALDLTRQLLCERHGLSESEARSLCIALASQVDLSIGRALAEAQ